MRTWAGSLTGASANIPRTAQRLPSTFSRMCLSSVVLPLPVGTGSTVEKGELGMRPPEAVLVARENEPRKPESSVTGSFCAGSDGDADMGLDSRE